MNPDFSNGTKPSVNVDAHANLDIKLDDWQAVAGLGVLGATATLIVLIIRIFR